MLLFFFFLPFFVFLLRFLLSLGFLLLSSLLVKFFWHCLGFFWLLFRGRWLFLIELMAKIVKDPGNEFGCLERFTFNDLLEFCF